MEESYHRLIIAYFEKTISDEGLTALQDWIEEHPDNLTQFSDTIHILEAAKASLKRPDNAGETWAKINTHITQQSQAPAVVRPIKRSGWLMLPVF
jgi:transmembrane sensor